MKKIAGVVVTYNRPNILKKCLESILAQTVVPNQIFVIDNSPEHGTRKMIKECFPFIEYKHFPNNIGSEGGYYEGIKLAYKNSDYIWLLDDDCTSKRNALAELIKWAAILEKESKVGAVRSARSWDKGNDLSVIEIEDLFAWQGIMILSETVKKIGLPIKNLFLYGGDIEYGLRIRKAGYQIYLVFSSKIESLDSSKKVKRSFWKIKTESYAQLFRIYYSYRNELWVYLKYKAFIKILKLLLYGAKNFCFHAVSGEIREAFTILEGIRDGAKKRLGKCRKYLPL